jgi:uncharacterized protein YvpB
MNVTRGKRGIALVAILFCFLLPTVAGAEPDTPESAYIPGVIGYPQERPLSCESRSAVDLAAFWGVGIGEETFFNTVPRSDNPYEGFVGDVDDPPGSLPPGGYGVYANPVADTLRRYGLDARAFRWLGLERLKTEVAAGRPVLIWATYDMLRPEIGAWTSADGSTSIIIQWEHTFILTGYDAQGVYLIDAYDGETQYYLTSQFVPAWMQLNEMAVVVNGPLERTPYAWQAERADGFAQWTIGGESLHRLY